MSTAPDEKKSAVPFLIPQRCRSRRQDDAESRLLEFTRSHHRRPMRVDAVHAHASIAACLAGQSRTLQHVWTNSYEAMIRPLASHVDLFATILLNNTRTSRVRTRLFSPADKLSFLEREAVSVVYRKPGDHLLGTTSHTPCYSLIEAHEHRRGQRYKWVLRLRTDVAYGLRMPSRLPEFASEPPTVWVEMCGPGGPRLPICPRFVANHAFACAKDTWALMSRGAASVYFNATLLSTAPKLCHLDQLGKISHGIRDMSPECRLGCTLHRHNITVRTVMSLGRTIVRNTTTRLPILTNNTVRLSWSI